MQVNVFHTCDSFPTEMEPQELEHYSFTLHEIFKTSHSSQEAWRAERSFFRLEGDYKLLSPGWAWAQGTLNF